MRKKQYSTITAAVCGLIFGLDIYFGRYFIYLSFLLVAVISGLGIYQYRHKALTKSGFSQYLLIPICYGLGALMFVRLFVLPFQLLWAGIIIFVFYQVIQLLDRVNEKTVAPRTIIMFALLAYFFIMLFGFNSLMLYGLPGVVIVLFTFAVTYLIADYLQSNTLSPDRRISLVGSLLMAELSWVLSNWNSFYPYRPSLVVGVSFSALLMTVVMYWGWSLWYERNMGRLTKKVSLEYFLIAGSVIIVLFLTSNWSRID